MTKILITGASGTVGKKTIEHLLNKGIPGNQLIAFSRNTEVLNNLSAKGVELRQGDYFDYESLLKAFEGVKKIMLTSAIAFTDRFTQHYNVIKAAKQMGVKHIVYMSVMRKAGSAQVLPQVTESDLLTEQALKSAGLDYTIVYHPPFADLLSLYYGSDPFENGIRIPANQGKMAPATRSELAEAHAEILSTFGHENKTYTLSGSHSISFAEIAKILSEIKNQLVTFTSITNQEFIEGMVSQGVPVAVAEFMNGWFLAIESGEFDNQSNDLEKLLGRKTQTFKELMQATLS